MGNIGLFNRTCHILRLLSKCFSRLIYRIVPTRYPSKPHLANGPWNKSILKIVSSPWLNQSIWKIWSSNWIISPGFWEIFFKPPPSFQENYNTPVEHTSGKPPATPTMKGIPKHSLLVKAAWGVFQFGVVKQPLIHQGKCRWHSYHVLVYISPVLTYLLGTVPCTLTMV